MRGCVSGACVGHQAGWVAGCGGRRGSLGGGVCGGRVWAFWQGGSVRVAVPGAVRVSGHVWATGCGVGREGQGVWGWACMRCVSLRICLPRCVCVVSCRAGGLEEELAVFRGRGEDFADAYAFWVHLLVGGGKRVLQGWPKAHAREDPVDGVIPADEGVLRSWRGSFRVLGPACTCVWVVRMAQIQGLALADGQRRLIHLDRQNMASPRR